jgi:hypothetical protein
MHTVVPATETSAQHAAIAWDGERWTLRDLASRHGTWLDGRRLGPGEAAPLQAGARIQLGPTGTPLTLTDAAPPAPFATSGELVVEGEGPLLALPSADDPVAVVLLDRAEGWILSHEGDSRPIEQGALVEVAGRRWTLSLPSGVEPTADILSAKPESAGLALCFKVTSDEEYVEVTVEVNGIEHTIPPRTHHYILLTLARARLEEADQPLIAQGWMYTTELIRQLRMSANQLYVGMYRARREFEAVGLPEGFELIERRAVTRQLRIAVPQLRITVI